MAGKDGLAKLDEARLDQYPEWRRLLLQAARSLETTSAVTLHIEGVRDEARIAELEAQFVLQQGGVLGEAGAHGGAAALNPALTARAKKARAAAVPMVQWKEPKSSEEAVAMAKIVEISAVTMVKPQGLTALTAAARAIGQTSSCPSASSRFWRHWR